MPRLQMLGEKEKVEFVNCQNDTNTINGIFKEQKIFRRIEWKIPTRFSKFWVAFKPLHYYLLELQNKRKHCIVKVWVCLYTLCYKFLLIEKKESIQLTVRLFWSGKKVHKEIKYFINLNTVTCCFFQSSAFFGLMDDRNSFSTASIFHQCTHSKLKFFNQLLFLV